MAVTKEKTKRRRQSKLNDPKAWVLHDDPIDPETLTDPERLMYVTFRVRYPTIFKSLRRSNAPYRGSGYLSDFTLEVEHYHFHGICIEIQGGIYSRHRTGHSSCDGLKRDYNKVTLAQANGWFIIQVPPDEDSLRHACDQVDALVQRFADEHAENEALLCDIAA